MAKNDAQTMHIECGVQGDIAQDPSRYFWPVFYMEYISTDWSPPQSKNFSIIFTSKNALNAFQESIIPRFNKDSDWKFLNSVCAVGNKTALLLKKTLPPYFFLYCKDVILPINKNGLRPLLLRKDIFSQNLQVFIFTSQVGKSFQIVDDVKDQCHFQTEVVPLYTLIDLKIELKETAFKSLFQFEKNSNLQVVFYCRSGQILKRVVSLLVQLFNVTDAAKLPSFVFFSTWEKSAYEALLELNLIDRKIS